jgi:hypothetical protein
MRRLALWSGVAALSLALAAPGFGQTAGAGGQAQGQSSGQTEVKAPPAEATTTAQTQAQASGEASADAQKTADAIKQKGSKVSAQVRTKAEAKLDAVAKKTNSDAEAQGEAKVASRLAGEFGMTSEQLAAQKQELGCSWGDLMIAHSLDANATADVTAAQLVQMHSDGSGWGTIAAGLGLKLGEVVSAVQAEGRVAAGLAKADGKTAVIHGSGSHAGLGAHAGASTGVKAGGASASAQTGVGVGVKVKP